VNLADERPNPPFIEEHGIGLATKVGALIGIKEGFHRF
jgi:hypothetical protein